ncbi:hypothetical protein MPSEU_000342300 [Mayamaea pseudoterrestris]|nr:hypothetical protein MPSEU_000342300 [Mayamaea pseudoterrestris]
MMIISYSAAESKSSKRKNHKGRLTVRIAFCYCMDPGRVEGDYKGQQQQFHARMSLSQKRLDGAMKHSGVKQTARSNNKTSKASIPKHGDLSRKFNYQESYERPANGSEDESAAVVSYEDRFDAVTSSRFANVPTPYKHAQHAFHQPALLSEKEKPVSPAHLHSKNHIKHELQNHHGGHFVSGTHSSQSYSTLAAMNADSSGISSSESEDEKPLSSLVKKKKTMNPKIAVKQKEKAVIRRKENEKVPQITAKQVQPNIAREYDGLLDTDDEKDEVSPRKNSHDEPSIAFRRRSKSKLNQRAVNKREEYASFQRKFNPAIDIEFKGTEIHPLFIAGCMWNRHQELFGETCGEECMCVLAMEKMSANVVKTKIRKRDHWDNPLNLDETTMPVGFMTNFANKFGRLLRNKYPSEPSSRLLERLINMWMIHRRQRMFGQTKCDEDCGCEEAWEFAFAEGALPDEVSASRKRKLPHGKCAAASSLTPAVNECKPDHLVTQIIQKVPRKSAPSAVTSTQMKEYAVDFDSTKPLGMYVSDETDSTGTSVCKVTSVAPNGQCECDSRVRCGSVVVGVVLNGDRQIIRSPAELKNIYVAARQNKTRLQLVFVNKYVSAAALAEGDTRQRNDWAAFGYNGAVSNGGWAGGAQEMHQILNRAINREQVSSLQTLVASSPPSPRLPLLVSSNTEMDIDLEPLRPAVRAEVGRSILKGGPSYLMRTTKRDDAKVQFSEHRYVCWIDFSGPATEFQPGGTLEDASTALVHKTRPGRQELFAAFQTQGIKETIMLLEEGAAIDVSRNDLDWIRKKAVKPRLDEVKSKFERTNDVILLPEIRDLVLKDKVMKIYANAEDAVRLAKAMKSWVCCEFCVETLDMEDLQVLAQQQPSDIYLKWSSQIKVAGVSESRRLKIANVIDGRTSETSCLHHNCCLDRDGKFDLFLVSKALDEKTKILGTATVARSDLCTSKLTWDEPIALKFVPTTGSEVPGATVKIRVRRTLLSLDFIESMRSTERTKIKEIADWIQRFNDDLSHEKGFDSKLSFNVQVAGESLLHAAVHLEDPELVDELICLGSRSGNNCKTSPLALALDMAEGSKDDRSAVLAKIVAVLRRHCSREAASPTQENLLNDETTCRLTEPAIAAVELSGLAASSEPAFFLSDCTKLPAVARNEPPSAQTPGHLFLNADGESDGNVSPITFEDLSLQVPDIKHPAHSRTSNTNTWQHFEPSNLPNVEVDWITPTSFLPFRCWYHEMNGSRCTRRTSRRDGCKHLHINRPWGPLWDDLWSECNGDSGIPFECHLNVQENSHFLEEKGANGVLWYTAKFSTAKDFGCTDQDIIFAEGSGYRSVQGVYWYETREDAYKALEKTVYATVWAARHNYHPMDGISGPCSLLPAFNYKQRRVPVSPSTANANQPYNQHYTEHQGTNISLSSRSEKGSQNMSVVRVTGLPPSAIEADICRFFQIRHLCPSQIQLIYDGYGRATREAEVSFSNEAEAIRALQVDGCLMGCVAITVKPGLTGQRGPSVSVPSPLEECTTNNLESSSLESAYIYMSGLPSVANNAAVEKFFIQRDIRPTRVAIVYNPDGKVTGNVLVSFANENDAEQALKLQGKYIGNYRVQLRRGTKQEFDLALHSSRVNGPSANYQ